MNVEVLMAKFATEWLGRQVDRVEAYGTDWWGSTEDGFSEMFNLTLIGPDHLWMEVGGDSLKDFWMFVMRQGVPGVS